MGDGVSMEFSRSLQIRPSPLANSPCKRHFATCVSSLSAARDIARESGEERGDTAVFAGQFFREHFGPISYPCGVSKGRLRPDPGDDLQKGLYRLKDAKNRHAGIWVILSIRCGASLVCFN